MHIFTVASAIVYGWFLSFTGFVPSLRVEPVGGVRRVYQPSTLFKLRLRNLGR